MDTLNMSDDDTIFKARRWGSEIYRSIQTYWHIQAFFGDTKVVENYLDSHKPLHAVEFVDGGFLLDDGSIVELPDDDENFESTAHTISLTQDEIKVNLQEAGQFYNRQMVVVTATYIELILRDFLRVAFSKFPERMHNYLDEGNGSRGLVSLKLITKAPSLNELLFDLSEQAASNALKGRFKTQLNNLARIIPEQEITQKLQSELISIVEKRNRIVHEASQEQISIDEVRQTLDTCLELLTSLANIAVKCDISLDIPQGNESENPF
jgi:uncharacterized protein YutE (UPF0331/DUF86 family)